MTELKTRLKENAKLVEAKLASYYTEKDVDLERLLSSEEYSLMAGGKRIRPFLAIEFCRLFGGKVEAAIPYAAGVEMIHTFSLIHDDLPCMDNDDLRRGKPTNHKVFGETTALLAGDGLCVRAFEVLASNEYTSAKSVKNAVYELSYSSGAAGMCGGQIMDIIGEEKKWSFDKLLKLHRLKTGALIRTASLLGCYAAELDRDDPRCADVRTYAENIGLAFQIIDDILDKIGDAAVLGKTIGSDSENDKVTFMTYMGVEEAEKYARSLTDKAIEAVSKYEGSEVLVALASYLLERKN